MNLTDAERVALLVMRDELRRDMDDARRYRTVRLIGPRRFHDLYDNALRGPKSFDELVDEIGKEDVK
jgi:hypothetical protein